MKKMFMRALQAGGKKIRVSALALIALLSIGTSAFASNPGDTPVSMAGVQLPFTVTGMLGTATEFLALYGPWVLLALGVIFSPVLYGLALRLVNYAKSKTSAK